MEEEAAGEEDSEGHRAGSASARLSDKCAENGWINSAVFLIFGLVKAVIG